VVAPETNTRRLWRATMVLIDDRRTRGLLAGCVLLGLASSFVLPYLSMFGTLEVGMSLTGFSLFMTITTIGNVIISSLLARWSDRLPSRRIVLLLGASAGAVGYAGYALLREAWQLALVGTTLLGAAQSTFSQLFADAREHIGRRGLPSSDAPLYMNAFRMAFAAAWTLGPALAAFALSQLGFRGLFGCAAGFYLAFLLLVVCFVPAQPGRAGSNEAHQTSPPAARDTVDAAALGSRAHLRGWFAAFVLMFAAQSLAMSNMSLYVLRELGGSEKEVGVIFSVAPVFEVPCMLYLGLLATRVRPATLIRGAMALSVAYFAAVACVGRPWHIYPLQIASAMNVAILSGVAITFFQNELPGRVGTGTNVYMNSTRLGSTSGFLLFGGLASRFGHRGTFVACALLALAALLGTRVFVGASARAAKVS
jgi:MFS transporter, SET family, sugar efflux transporter